MKSQDKLKYPIGRFEYGKNYSLDETRRNIKAIAKLPKELKKALKKLRSGDLDKSYRKGGWTVRQVVHHIADSHMNAYIRMKLAVTEPTPVIKPYEEANWAETEDSKTASVKLSLKLLAPLHRRWVMFLETLSEEDLERGYFHPEMQRIIPLPEAIALYAWHSKHHLAHIRLVTTGKGEAIATLSAALPRATKAKRRGQQAKASAEKSATSAVPASTVERKKPGPKPKARPIETVAPAKRKRRTKAEMEAAQKAASVVSAERKKPGPKPKPKAASDAPKLTRAEVLAKARAARAANLAKQVPAKSKVEPAATPKRTRRSSAEVAAEKAAKAAAPKLSRAEVLAKARAARAANLAKQAPAKSKVEPAATPKRTRRSSAEVAAEKAAKAAAPKLTRAEVLAKARAARAAKLAEKPTPKAKTAAKPAGESKRRGMSPEHMAKIREARMAKRAAAGATPTPKAKPAPDAPKLTRAEVLAKARAARTVKLAEKPAPKTKPAAKPAGESKRKGMSPERMAEIRAMRGKK